MKPEKEQRAMDEELLAEAVRAAKARRSRLRRRRRRRTGTESVHHAVEATAGR